MISDTGAVEKKPVCFAGGKKISLRTARGTRFMKNRHFLFCIIMLALWIGFIFARSLKPAYLSGQESLWVLNLLTRLVPFRLTMNQVRKLAHFTEFAVLGILISSLFRDSSGGFARKCYTAFPLGLLTAVCDETIQLFVDGRSGQIQDVWIDCAGAVTGYLVWTLCRFLLRKVQKISRKS